MEEPVRARRSTDHEGQTLQRLVRRGNDKGLDALDPEWAGARPRLITSDDEGFIIATARTRPEKPGRPFTHRSLRKLAAHRQGNPARRVRVPRLLQPGR
ncbi:helix-turn-helix domain-containing protein [Microbispora bryophytorum]|uniref:helix-turn-helix domain-containing protein n=1 Tax=Microbispora bryophytorum TaxID=1460882 RepID=UPI003F4CE9EE